MDIFSPEYRRAVRVVRDNEGREPTVSEVDHLCFGRALYEHGHVTDHGWPTRPLPLGRKDDVRHLYESLRLLPPSDVRENLDTWRDIRELVDKKIEQAAQERSE